MAKQVVLTGLSPRAEKGIRRLSTVAVLGLAIAAAILSFSGLQTLALQAGFPPQIAWLFPVVIDGMVLTGSLGVVSANLVGISTWYPWTITVLGVSASIAGNVAAAPPNLSAQLVHAAAPLTFALSIEGMLRIYRASALASAERERERYAKEEADAERREKAAEREARIASRVALTRINTADDQPVLAAENPRQAIAQTSPTPTSRPVNSPAAGTPTTRDKVRELLASDNNLSAAEIARRLESDPSYIRKLIRELRAQEDTRTSETATREEDANALTSDATEARPEDALTLTDITDRDSEPFQSETVS